ncbi:unnamed protein product [Brassica rapa subsp. trilocularis]
MTIIMGEDIKVRVATVKSSGLRDRDTKRGADAVSLLDTRCHENPQTRVTTPREEAPNTMANPEEEEEEEKYESFLSRVRRTVYVDELTPHASKSVVESAFSQFGTVKDVIFLPNYLGPKELPTGVLVEMESEQTAKAVIETVSQFPFMVAGMPRPVRASAARPAMFSDRPKKPGRTIQFRWVDPSDAEFDKAQRVKRLVRKHTAEAAFMIKKQLEEAEELAKQQSETVTTHHKKFEMIDKLTHDRVAQELAGRYNIKCGPPHR